MHEKLFAKENLEVSILSGRGSADTVTKLATGVADIGESGLGFLMQAQAQGSVPVKAVMPVFTRQPDALLTTTTGPAGLKGFVGQSVATSPFTSSNVAWPMVLQANNIDPNSIKVLKADPAALPGLLVTGQVAGVINWVTSAASTGQALATAGKTMKILAWSDYGYQGYAQSLLASDKMIKDRPDVLRRFLKVYREAEKIMQADPQRAADAVKALVPEADIKGVKTDVDAAVPLIFNATTTADGLGKFTKGLVGETWQWVAKAQALDPAKLDPNAVIDNTFVD